MQTEKKSPGERANPGNPNPHDHFDVAIIGAGFGGLAAALQLLESGRDSFVIFERAESVGGTWRENTYPGCACDIESHLYSLSKHQNPDWSRQYPLQPEILGYLQETANHFRLHEKTRFGTEVHRMRFDARAGIWYIKDRKGGETTARNVVLAIGILNRPKMPDIPGLDSFAGEIFHSSRWNHDYDLHGKRVAVIGTGASAIQFVPHVARAASQMTLFQRSAPWVIPKPNRRYSRLEAWLFRVFPSLLNLSRRKVFWTNELRGKALLGNPVMRFGIKMIGRLHIRLGMRDKQKRKLVQPRHEFGCKRVLLSNEYYPALDRQNVEISTTSITSISGPDTIRTADGTETRVDAIVLGTGFDAAELNIDLQIRGLDGRELLSEWQGSDGPEAYLGTTISGFPNFLMLLGPNTGLGHNSVVYIIESQLGYLRKYLELQELDGQQAYLDVLPEAQREYNAEIAGRLSDSVWSTGCSSWYTTSSGKNSVIWPRGAHHFEARTRQIDPGAYRRVTVTGQPNSVPTTAGAVTAASR